MINLSAEQGKAHGFSCDNAHEGTFGFTLIELSVVLLIIALIVGGVLAGRDLIRASEQRSIIREAENFQVAARTFQGKYGGFPGDIANATDYWGATTCPGTVGTGTQTCNGDGDAIMETSIAASNYTEIFMFWQHLSNAGLIPGSYTGMSGPTGGGGAGFDHVLGVNHPASKLSPASWWVYNQNISGAGGGVAFRIDYGNFIQVAVRTTGVIPNQPFLLPDDAWNIDRKIDDGKPGTGRVIARDYNNCATGGADNTDVLNAVYNVGSGQITCSLNFIKIF